MLLKKEVNSEKTANDMVAPDKIYIAETPNKLIEIWSDEPIEPKPYITEHEYIRKGIVDETIKTAEDHAYFAGQEEFREKLIEWAKENIDSLGRLSYGELIDKLNSL